MNAVAISWGWLYLQDPDSFRFASEEWRGFIHSVCSHTDGLPIDTGSAAVDLVAHSAWAVALQGWEIGRHEDAAEFVTHVLGHCAFAGLQFQLQTRRCTPGSSHAIASETTPYLFLTLPLSYQNPSDTSLDDHLRTWAQSSVSEDGSTHLIALLGRPSLLCIHLLRFYYQEARVQKECRPVPFGEIVNVPVWHDEDNVTCTRQDYCRYRVCSVVCHHGPSARAGHYTAYLCAREGGGYHCDDLTPPRWDT